MEELFNMIANAWDGGLSEMYEGYLSPDMIEESVSRACEFFHIEEPLDIRSGESTGVGLGDMDSYHDDIQFYSQSQLADMGITGQDGLDLVMTHEGTHRVLQNMDTGFNSYQEELCCDYMAGVRAGLNGMDVSQLENSLIDMPQGLEHPEGTLRVEAVEQGMAFAHEYMEVHGTAPTFNECLEDFKGEHIMETADLAQMRNEIYGQECTMEHYRHLLEREPDNEYVQQQFNESEARYQELMNDFGARFQDSNEPYNREVNFKGITPPDHNSDGYIHKGKITLESTVSEIKHSFTCYEKGGHLYVYEGGKWIQIDGSGTVRINNIKYDKV